MYVLLTVSHQPPENVNHLSEVFGSFRMSEVVEENVDEPAGGVAVKTDATSAVTERSASAAAATDDTASEAAVTAADDGGVHHFSILLITF